MKNVLKKGWRPTLVIILLLTLWEIAGRIFDIPAWLLPVPTQVWQEAIHGWMHYSGHILSTIRLTLTGYAIGMIVGLAVATLLFPSTRFTGSILSSAYFIAKYSNHRFGAFARHLVWIRHVAESHRHCARLLFPNHHCNIGRFTANRPGSVALYENDRCDKSTNFLEVAMAPCTPFHIFRFKNCGYI